jgi:hypothetical protein
MKSGPLAILAVFMALVVSVSVAGAAGLDTEPASRVLTPDAPGYSEEGYRGARLETLWIFDDDISSDLGWTSFDRSGTLAQVNYWHHDTIRVTQPYLGTSTWWCGTYNICWRQPRGYGNEWRQILKRTLTAGEMGTEGDLVEIEWDQRYAMERLYDYGYVEVMGPSDTEWVTLASFNNTGFQGAGIPHNWTHPQDGHVLYDISSYAGEDVELRYRFESDEAYSAQDQYDNAQHSVRDGAWQLDNITVSVNGSPTFYDDSESGNLGWVHEDTEQSGNVGVQFFRGRFGIDFVTGREFTCDDRPYGSWMYAAVDPFSSKMVNGENTWLVSPPIDISGAMKLVGQWDMWVDLPYNTNDIFDLSLASNDLYECVTDPGGFVDEAPGGWYGGPFWGVWTDDWDAFTGNDWLAIRWELYNREDATEPHMAGIFLNRQRVGIPSGDPGTAFERDTWYSFHDWFEPDVAEALEDTARIRVKDDDDIASLYVMASADGGDTWEAYECHRESPDSDWWDTPPPVNQIARGNEIYYYWEATDGVGNVQTYPGAAPRLVYEMSILPLQATTDDPGLLLVDKHGRLIPGDDRDYNHSSEYYFREALEVLGYEWETYDVDVPSGTADSEGPDTSGMKYYDTQVWFSDEFDSFTFWKVDQYMLIQWLSQAAEGKERNLLVTGNDVGKELMGAGVETLNFYTTWLASDYISNDVGVVTVDSVPGLDDRAGGYDFMTDDGDPDTALDGDCALTGACPSLNYFDVVDARAGLPGNEVVADYCKVDGSKLPAGVAYTHPTIGYQSVNLGFGMEFMVDGDCALTGPNTHAYYDGAGHFMSGIEARADLMKNILEYFELTAGGPGTDVVDGGYKNVLAHAAPNPFNPVTKIAYSVKEAGPVTIEVYNIAGRVVRTLLDTELEAGTDGYVVWDGTNDLGERCASGVYFYRITAPDFSASRKMVMLK